MGTRWLPNELEDANEGHLHAAKQDYIYYELKRLRGMQYDISQKGKAEQKERSDDEAEDRTGDTYAQKK